MTISVWEMLLRLLLATGVGLLLGFERERSKKPAGIRTHVLICMAACLIAIISAYGFADYYAAAKYNDFRGDPARLVVGVLTGIGFIGAGIIWKSPTGSVVGITTAAEIFLLAALGIAAGLGLYVLLAAGTVIAILTMIADDVWEKYRLARAKRKAAAAKEAAAVAAALEAENGEDEAEHVPHHRDRPYRRVKANK